MNLKLVSLYKNTFFALLLSLGLAYLLFLFYFTPKIVSSFLMQIIFILGGFQTGLSRLLSQPEFYIQIVVGFLWFYLLIRLFTSTRHLFNQIKQTNKLAHTIKKSQNQGQYYLIKSGQPEAFTLGFFAHKVYLSQSLLKLSTGDELSSILYHELTHVANHDPLKNLIINFISRFLPGFPLKSWLFGQYFTLTEINCDLNSQNKLTQPLSLISALFKIQKYSQSQLVTGFSAQSERIKILVGQKSLAVKSTLFTGLTVMALVFAVSGTIYRTDIFYQCTHLIECFENIFVPDHVISPTTVKTQHCFN